MSGEDLKVEPITNPDPFDRRHGYTHQICGAYHSGARWRQCFRSKAAATRALNKKLEIERLEAERCRRLRDRAESPQARDGGRS